jgi:methyl-accepting chemotaxis protein
MLRLANIRISGRLIAGFTAVSMILAASVGYTAFVLRGVGQNVDRMANVRMPVSIESAQLASNLYATLAALRAYLMTASPQGKAERAAIWIEIDAIIAQIDKTAEQFTDTDNKSKWTEAKKLLVEFRAAQDKAEAIAFTADAYPATKLLQTEGVPLVDAMFSELGKLISEEENLEFSPERKRLLITMGDVRSNLAAAIAQIRMYLMSGAEGDWDKFTKPWENFERSFGALMGQQGLLNAVQKRSFEKIVKARGDFALYPDRINSIRESAQWNMPVYILTTEVTTRANKILDLIDGARGTDGIRAGGIKSNEQKLLIKESQEIMNDISFLTTIELILLAIGLSAATTISFLTARSIIRPIQALTAGMLELANGNFAVVLPGLSRKDEIGRIAGAVETFKLKAVERARSETEEKAEFDRRTTAERDAATEKMSQEFEATIGSIVKSAVAGDFSQRVALDGKSGLVRNIGLALNSLCENTEKVMKDLITMFDALASGDFRNRITADYQGTFGKLKNDANLMADRIGATVAELKASALEVTHAANEISISTTDLSQRTEEQAASLEQTSASMEEIAATVKKTAENAQQANKTASSTCDVASRGGQVVTKTVDAMTRIEESSRKIADIIGIIDEIARQTNLLALNAAVEAARAGDAGRGFSVVASEVRNLAQRSSQAAKDIKNLITTSNEQVRGGVELVNRAGASLQEIVESIKKVADVVAEIAVASAEQATGIEQVNRALTQMDEVTQQNSALVEQNAATAKMLEHQSRAMNERVSFFRIDDAAIPTYAFAPAQMPAAPRHKSAARVTGHRPIAAANGGSSRGPVGRMQSRLATAIDDGPDWNEF